MTKVSETFIINPKYRPALERLGLRSAADVFATSHARVWRSITERENATIDPADAPRMHLKRDKRRLPPARSAAAEARGIAVLASHGLPTATLIAHGTSADGRSFAITEDLEGYRPADVALRAGSSFESLAAPLARTAGAMHGHRLFHRDLYLCHFMVRQAQSGVDVRMIDLARVLVRPFFAWRWQTKDLAQLVYSTREFGVGGAELQIFFEAYAAAAGGREVTARRRREIERKVSRIARHDARLHRSQPGRDVSLQH